MWEIFHKECEVDIRFVKNWVFAAWTALWYSNRLLLKTANGTWRWCFFHLFSAFQQLCLRTWVVSFCHSSVTDLDQIDQIDLILKGDTMSSRLVQEEFKKNYLSEIVKIKVPDWHGQWLKGDANIDFVKRFIMRTRCTGGLLGCMV